MRNAARIRFLRVTGWLGILLVSCCPLIVPDPPPKEEAWPSWAPDGQHVVYECYLDGPIQEGSRSIFDLGEAEGVFQSFYTSEAADICISDINQHNQIRLVGDSGGDWHPVWSPDGSQIAYLRKDGIYLVTRDGQNPHQLVHTSILDLGWSPAMYPSTGQGISLNWSPQGNHLLFSGCLEYRDHDVYLVDVDTGAITNLTPGSRAHDFSPMWTLNGTKITFLSTDSSSQADCRPGYDVLPQLKSIDADGSNERTIYDPDFYYLYWMVSVSNSGQVALVTNMVSKTEDDYFQYPSTRKGSMYEISLVDVEGTPVEIIAVEDERIVRPTRSPSEELVAYMSNGHLKILDVATGDTLYPWQFEPIIYSFVWSPDSQKLAVLTSVQEDMASDSEDHIYIYDIESQAFHPLVQQPSSP